jgi:cardiolipin synthase
MSMKRRWRFAAVSAVVSLAATLVVLNLQGGEKRIESQLPRLYETDDAEFERSLSSLMGPQLLAGNQVDPLTNGDEIFPAMLEAIKAARRTITFEPYIYWSGEVGEAFVAALAERAQAGDQVHVPLDWVGSLKMEEALLERMRESGIVVVRFYKPHWSNWGKMNNRTHRKLLVVDGSIGFTGGVGIADQWTGDARNPDEWRDAHFRVRGPVVAQMQAVFLNNWMRATGAVLHGEAYFPVIPAAGLQRSHMFSSSPSGGSESMHLMYLLALTAAKKSILLSASYFVPDALTIKTLIDAAHRGVKIRVILPNHHIDAMFVREASRESWGALLDAGVQIAEYQPTMFHVKSLVVDGYFSSVGSTNFDNRSFRLNDEANLNVIDRAFGQAMAEVFEEDWSKSRAITQAEWQGRPLHERAMGQLTQIFRSQL